MTITLTQAYIKGYGCKDCNHWEPNLNIKGLGNCKRQIFAPTWANEICEHITNTEE